MRRLILVAVVAGLLLVAGGLVATPGFVREHASPDGILEPSTMVRIEDVRLRGILAGHGLVGVGLAAGLAGLVRRRAGAVQPLGIGVLYAAIVAGSLAAYVAQRYPDHLLFRGRDLLGALIGRELLLKDFQPRSSLVSERTEIVRARHPVINVHEHFTYPKSIGERRPEDFLRAMDAVGVWKVADMDGGLGDELRRKIETYQRPHPDRFLIFAHVWFGETGDHARILSGEIVNDLAAAAQLGARGIKIWKNLGLRSRDASGRLIPVNDPRLDPLWSAAADLGLPILIHVADDPDNFATLDRFNESYEFLRGRPEWSFASPEFPRPREILSQLEDVLRRHPRTTFIGAHMAMSAHDLAYLAGVLDRHPNLFVDTAFQIQDLGRQPHAAREFFVRFQDRILFGTDTNPTLEDYRAHFRFLETDDDHFDPPFAYMNLPREKICGIALPDEVLRKVYFENALRVLGDGAGPRG